MKNSALYKIFFSFFMFCQFGFAQVDVVYSDLVWSDEFNTNGGVNPTNWFHQTQIPASGSWFNGEVQHYTDQLTNSFVNAGTLNIVAKKEPYTDQGITKQYTSARLNSKFAFKYGRVEVRAKLPIGAGTWPAIWMLGKNIIEPGGYWTSTYGSVGWPACGEIDIMEHWGTNQNVISSAVHHPINGNLTVNQYVSNAQNKPGVSTDFHIYALEWDSQRLTFSVDGINHLTYNPTVKNQYTWPFDAEQYILLNVAIEPSVTTSFVQSTMEIDYVRVYQQTSLGNNNITKEKELVLFPNPTSDKLNLRIAENQIGNRVTIFSVLGQELNSYILNTEETILDVSHYQNGIYLLKINTNSDIQSYKFVKK